MADLLFPAYAGVIPPQSGGGGPHPTFPRVCGGDPQAAFVDVLGLDFSPRMRG